MVWRGGMHVCIIPSTYEVQNLRTGEVEGVYLSEKPLCWRVFLRGSSEKLSRRNIKEPPAPQNRRTRHCHTGNIAVAPQVSPSVRLPIKLTEANGSLSCLKIAFCYGTRGATVPLQTFPHYSIRRCYISLVLFFF